jgi:metallo-beta-lactamase family protein
LRDGAEQIHLFGQEYQVRAKLFQMDSFSAHGDEEEMLNFLEKQDKDKLRKIFLVHGEEENQKAFGEALLAKGFQKVERPVLFQEYKLEN